MSDNEFIQELRNLSNFTPVGQLPEFSKAGEAEARRIIKDIDKRYRQNIAVGMKNDSTIIHVRVNDYDGRKVIQLQSRTAGCRMKKCGSCWNCNYGVKEKSTTTPEEYIQEFERLIDKYVGATLVMEAMGSITDNKEFPKEALYPMIDIAIKKGKFKSISLETHITQIDEKLVKYIYQKNQELPEEQRKWICFEVGIEDFNPENRKLINKIGVKNSKIEEVYNLLDRYGMELDCNLIYGFPFLTEDERIESMVQNVQFAKEHMPNAGMILFLMSIKDNTIMRRYAKKRTL